MSIVQGFLISSTPLSAQQSRVPKSLVDLGVYFNSEERLFIFVWFPRISTTASSSTALKSHLKETLEEGTARTRQLTPTCWCKETLSDLGWSRQTGGNKMLRVLARELLLPSWLEALQLKLPDMCQSTSFSCRVKSLDGSPNGWLFLYHCNFRGGGFALA